MRRQWLRPGLLLAFAVVSGLEAADTQSSLIDAVKQGNREAVRALLAKPAELNRPEPDGTTALHWAVRANDRETVALLIRAGAKVSAANRYGVKPLTLAAINGDAAIIEQLLKAGADPDTATAEGETALLTASRSGSVAAIKALIAHGANVNAREHWLGETALMWAAAEDHAEAVRTLVAAGADRNARSTVQDTPVLEFPRSGGPNAPFPRGGWTPLMFAARDGAIEAARALAELGANPDLTAIPETDVDAKNLSAAASGVGTTAMVFAIINAHYDLAAMLLEQGADPNVVDLAGMGALYAAVDMNSLQWVQGRPAPIFTDRLDGVALVKQLLLYNADPNARLKTRPLKRHHDAGSTLNFGEGTTPLMRAARTNDVAVMKVLLDGGANPFLTLPDRTNALLLAAGQGYGGTRGDGPRLPAPTEATAIAAVTLLLDRGADIRYFNEAGNTVLHAAVPRGDELVAFLIEHGASITAANKAGLTPLDLAQGAGGRRGGRGPVRDSTVALLKRLSASR
ncbi:MAG: ankyrin repeat domain-containing protein [Acidobacteriota bacterium]